MNSVIGTKYSKSASLNDFVDGREIARKSLSYVEKNYISLQELAEHSQATIDYVLTLIANEVIPAPSYTIKRKVEITSALNDEMVMEEETMYFNKSLVEKIQGLKSLELPVDDLKQLEAEIFEVGLQDELEDNFYKSYGYPEATNGNDGFNQEVLELAIAREWKAYLDGVYGICTKAASVKQIVAKEIAVNRLKEILLGESGLSRDEKKREVIKAVEAYDQVGSSFAPYQRERSSRGQYVDRLITEFQLGDEVSSYHYDDL